MKREDLWGILGSLLLVGMAWLDTDWRWFWAGAGAIMLTWSLYAVFSKKTDG